MVKRAPPKTSSIMLGLEAQLWDAANALRGSIDPSEYKRVVLGPLSLEYIPEAFEEHRKRLSAEEPYANPEYPNEYRVDNIFRIPLEARCPKLRKNVHQPIIEKLVTRRIPEPHSAIHPQYPHCDGRCTGKTCSWPGISPLQRIIDHGTPERIPN